MSLHDPHGLPRSRASLSPVLLAGVLGGLAALSGCGDSPYCVFGGDCRDEGVNDVPGGIGREPATVPANAQWIHPDPPEVEQMRPAGSNASSTTPIVIRFTESLNPDTLAGAFEIVNATNGLPVFFLDPPALVGDGRVVVLDPLMDLAPANSYIVQFAATQSLTDLTGQALEPPSDDFIGDFNVMASDPDEPFVVASYPSNNQINQSDVTEIVVVFDRVMDVTTFDTDSWSVTVDGVAPLLNPPPVPYFIDGPTQIPVPNIFRWASVNPQLERASLGVSGFVELTLSAAGNELEDPDDNVLPETVIAFDIAPIGVPSAAFKPAQPTDAFGRDELLGSDIVLQVDLPANALDGDILRVFVFGTGPDPTDGFEAVSRRVDITAATNQIDVTGEDMNLIVGSGGGRFLTGTIDVAVRLERGNIRTPVRLADSDPVQRDVQSYFFDVIPPELLGLGTSGTVTSSAVSDVRDLVIVGRANEQLRAVRVGTDAGMDNYTGPDDRPPVVISGENGLFVAAPVPLGVIDSTLAPPLYTVEIFDRAMNSTMAVGGRFDQLGAVGPGGDPTGGTMQVTVFDALSLERLENALVLTHQDDGGAITFVDSAVTSATGIAGPDGAAVGETIVTVDLPGYDLFTFHGAPQEVLHVPLVPTGFARAMTGGRVTTPFNIDLSDEDNRIGDSRIGLRGARLFEVAPCTEDPILGGMRCPFGPGLILPERLGLQTVLSADLAITQAAFDPEDFLLAFTLRGPVRPVAMGEAESVTIAVDTLLTDLTSEGEAIATTPEIFALAGAPALGDVDVAPTVTIEAVTPGVNGSSVVGLGLAYDPLMTEENWDVFAAYPGAVDGIAGGMGDELGELIVQGTFEADLFLRAELVDVDGDSIGVRSRFTNLDGVLDPFDAPEFLLPGPGNASGGLSFNVVLAGTIPDAAGADGLYRVTLTDATGRAWTLWRPDPAGAGNVTVHVPNIGAEGGTPLAMGSATCEISAFAWETLDPNLFMWSDIEREHEFFAHTAPATFTIN